MKAVLIGAFILLATGWGFAILYGLAAAADWLRRRRR